MNALSLLPVLAAASFARGLEIQGQPLTPADGYTVSVAAPSSLIERPVEACFDDKGRLYVTEVTGTNEPPQEQLKKAPHRVLRVEDTDGDGVFDKRTVFADKLGFPEGVLWHQGVVYVAAPPQIWKFTDANDDGVAEKREVWFDGKTLTGCANDLHGPYAGPDGLIYWCKGAFAEQTHDLPNQKGWKSRASHVFRMRADGTEFDVVFTAGMDNPVGLEWLPEGDLIVSGTFFQHPGDGRRDGLIHAVRGGVWGKDHDVLDGHIRTGPLMPVMTHMGPAAPCGMCRYGRDLLVCQFNLRKVSRHVLEPHGSTWKTTDSDFLTCEHPDFHPTDVLQAPDGSVLVVDTGGWYKICCPTSQMARPDVTGGIYRLRKAGGEVSTACPEPRWKLEKPEDFKSLKTQALSANLHIRRMAVESIGMLSPTLGFKENGAWNRQSLTPLLMAAEQPGTDRFLEHAIIYAAMPFRDFSMLNAALGATPDGALSAKLGMYCLSQTDPAQAEEKAVLRLLASTDAGVREAAVFGLRKVPAWREAAGVWLKEQLAGSGDPALLRGPVQAVASEGNFRKDLGAWLSSAKPGPMQHMLLEVMTGIAPRHEFVREWAEPLLGVLGAADAKAAALTAGVFAAQPPRKMEGLREKLEGVAREENRSATVRLPLMLALSPITPSDEEFSLLMAALNPETPPDSPVASLASVSAAVLSKARLSDPHLRILAEILPQIGLLHRPALLRAFSKATDEALGLALVEQLEKSGALNTLPAQDLAECLGKFPDKVKQRLTAARAKLNTGAEQQKARLDELEKTLPSGDALRGKVVFQSAKASCVLCHQAGYFGKHIGPDLSKIGGIRTRRDLLEAIAFPSASFVRSYEPVEIKKKDGTPAYGIIRNQNPQSVTLLTGAVTPDVTVPAAEIAEMKPGAASLMPQGVDLILTPQELADLVAFLMSLK
jgi:putative membrane-bound dehydrogenase-like protein